jgi:hypothetical protein
MKNLYKITKVKEKTMVKKILVVLFFAVLLGLAACATSPQVDYSQIIDVPKVAKDDLFVKTNVWAVEYFNNADSVIALSDKEAGIISGTCIGESHLGLSLRQALKSTFTISVKDEKVKLDLKPVEFVIYGVSGGPATTNASTIIKDEDIVAEYNAALESLKKTLTNSSDW